VGSSSGHDEDQGELLHRGDAQMHRAGRLGLMLVSWRTTGRIEHGVLSGPGVFHSARRTKYRLRCNIWQALEAFPIGIYSNRNELLRGRAADHDGTHCVLHVELQTCSYIVWRRKLLVASRFSGAGTILLHGALACTSQHGDAPMTIENLNDLFLHTVKDIYFAERQIVKALPKMVKNADSKELAKALQSHLEETKEQVVRLEQVFKELGKKPEGEECPAIEGILEEAEELMSKIKDPDTRDAAMIAAAQAVEHYEITRYGTLVAWGGLLGLTEAVKLLSATLKEEHAADSKLTKIAETKLNKQAA
jgi:ferritin-like metal-binding protein YciE